MILLAAAAKAFRRPLTSACLMLLLLAFGCGEGEDRAVSEPPSQQLGSESDAPMLVAALGDSITAGSPLWDPDPAVRGQLPTAPDAKSQYEYWAQRRLEARFRNCGVFGERTDQIADRLEGCAEGAEVLIVQGGINDIAQMRRVKSAARNLERMVRRGKQLGLEVFLVDVLPWNNGYPGAARRIRRLNRLIQAVGKRENVPVLPFYDTLDDPDAPGRMRLDRTIDGNHPSVEGYRRLAELIPPPGRSKDAEGKRP